MKYVVIIIASVSTSAIIMLVCRKLGLEVGGFSLVGFSAGMVVSITVFALYTLAIQSIQRAAQQPQYRRRGRLPSGADVPSLKNKPDSCPECSAATGFDDPDGEYVYFECGATYWITFANPREWEKSAPCGRAAKHRLSPHTNTDIEPVEDK